MVKKKIEVAVPAKSGLEEQLFKQAIEQIARHFTGVELAKVANKLENPSIRLQIKGMI